MNKMNAGKTLKEMPAPHAEAHGEICTARSQALIEIVRRRRADSRTNSVIARKLSMGNGPLGKIVDQGGLPTERQLQLLAHEYGVILGFELVPFCSGYQIHYAGMDMSALIKPGKTMASALSRPTAKAKRKPAAVAKQIAAAKPVPATASPIGVTGESINDDSADEQLVERVVRILQRGASAAHDLDALRRERDAAVAEVTAERQRADIAEERLREVQDLMTRIRRAAEPLTADNDIGATNIAA